MEPKACEGLLLAARRILACYQAVRIVDISTKDAHAEHERAKAELKGLVPEDAKEAVGHGLRARRSKSGAISFRPSWRKGQLDHTA